MSVKTGAVGSNPKIDKLINADAESLRRFAATTMLNKIMQTSAPVTGGSDENQVDPATAEAGRKTIRDNIMKTPASGNLEKGNYVKESDKENAIQKSLGMVVEMQRQKQAASVLAFSEDDAMKRNGITEEDRKEFFANYLTLESEYLVEGAMLTCTQATNEMIIIKDPVVSYQDHVYSDQPTKTENPLVKVKNPANDGEKKYATVSDCKKNVNISIFKNCKLTNASESKVLEKNNDCKKYGTCFALMDLCEKWVNVADGAAYGTAGAGFKNCINMLSHLGCYQGGIIFPLNTGQGEVEIIDEDFNIKEEILRLIDEEGIEAVEEYIQKLRKENPGVDEFLELLGERENNRGYSYHPTDRKHSYYGRFQIGDETFDDIGYKDKNTGIWTELAKSLGVTSYESFLNNKTAQDVAIIFALRWDYQYILSNDDDKYFNTQVEGVTVTESGVIAAYHLVGQKKTNQAFNGVIPWEKAMDGNEVPATTYMEEMGGLDLSVLFGGIE